MGILEKENNRDTLAMSLVVLKKLFYGIVWTPLIMGVFEGFICSVKTGQKNTKRKNKLMYTVN